MIVKDSINKHIAKHYNKPSYFVKQVNWGKVIKTYIVYKNVCSNRLNYLDYLFLAGRYVFVMVTVVRFSCINHL